MQIIETNTPETGKSSLETRFWEIARLWGLHPVGAGAALALVIAAAHFMAPSDINSLLQAAGLVLLVPIYVLQVYRFDGSRSLALAKALGLSLSISSGSYGPWLIGIAACLGAFVLHRRRRLTSA